MKSAKLGSSRLMFAPLNTLTVVPQIIQFNKIILLHIENKSNILYACNLVVTFKKKSTQILSHRCVYQWRISTGDTKTESCAFFYRTNRRLID